MSTPVAVPVILYLLPSLVAEALPWPVPDVYASVTPLTLPSPTDFTWGGLASVSTAPMPVAAPPIAMLTLPPAVVHTTEPLTFWFLPSMATVGPPPALADALPPEVAP